MIDQFNGEHRFLSNFTLCTINFEGINYPSTEHAYQAAKTLNPEYRSFIARLPTPGQAKRRGQRLLLRPYWDKAKLIVMYQINKQKFDQQPYRQLLLDTYPHELVEGNNWGDTFWGICDDVGRNELGKILMRIRDELS